MIGSDGSNLRRLTTDGGGFPSWSPDGQHIAFHSDRDGNYEIYVMDSDGSNLRRLTKYPAVDWFPSWSPDGQHIAFHSDRDGNVEIYVMDSDGSNPRRLTHHSDRDWSPSWSPDGQHIAFRSYRDGNYEVYVIGSDGSNLRRLTHHSASDGFPSWSPDGQHIAFGSRRDGDWEIYVMELREAGSGGTPFDDGDSPATATPLAVSEFIEGELLAGDIDYFRVSVGSAGRLIASTTGGTDTYGFIEDSSGNVLDENDDSGEGDNFLVSAVVEPGTYYIRVLGVRASSTGAYTLTLYLDEDSTPSSATPVAVGESIEGKLLTGDIDYFRVSVGSAGRLIASTTGGTDTYGFIEDSLGNVLGESDGGGAGDNFRVGVAVEPGTYYIRVRGYDASSTGAYTLTLHLDEDGSPAAAIPVAVGESIEGELLAGDIDYFRVSVSSAGRLVALTTGSTDAYGFIEDSSGNVLSRNNDSGEGDNFLVSAVVEPGTYYIGVLGANTSITGAYTLTLHLDDDSNPAMATPVAVGESIEGELLAGDIDYFRVIVGSAGRLIVWTTGSTDTYGFIEDSAGNVLNENDDSGEGDNFRVGVDVEPGTYYIGMHGANTSITGAYTLTLHLDDDGSLAAATPVAVGESIEDDLSPVAGLHDVDFFRVIVGSAGRLIAWTTGSMDTYGSIKDSSNSPSMTYIGEGEGDNFLVSMDVEPGTYYIRVHGVDTSITGAYTLTLDFDDDLSPATATLVAVGESIEDDLSPVAGLVDVDYFRVIVGSAGELIVWTTGSTDTYGSIEDNAGNVLSGSSYGGGGRQLPCVGRRGAGHLLHPSARC